jgi:hypothetical protein
MARVSSAGTPQTEWHAFCYVAVCITAGEWVAMNISF